MGTRVPSIRPSVRGSALIVALATVAGSLIVAIAMAFSQGSERALAEHAGAGGHGIQLECTPDPFEVTEGDTVTVTYVVRNAAGLPGNQPDHDVSFTLTDDWVGDIVNPGTAGTQSDSLQHHMSPSASTFTEGVDQITYTRTFTVGDVLLNTVVLTGDFDDEHIAQASIQCNLELLPPTPTPTSTLINEVLPTVTVPAPTPTPTRITQVLGPPTGDGSSGASGLGVAAMGLLVALVAATGTSALVIAYRRAV